MHQMNQESKQKGKKESNLSWNKIKIAMLTLTRYFKDNHLNTSKLFKP